MDQKTRKKRNESHFVYKLSGGHIFVRKFSREGIADYQLAFTCTSFHAILSSCFHVVKNFHNFLENKWSEMFLQRCCNILRTTAAAFNVPGNHKDHSALISCSKVDFNFAGSLKSSVSTTSSILSKIQAKNEPKVQTVNKTESPITKINEQLKSSKIGRMFAVVHICGKQFKVTDGDIVVVEGYWAPTVGDQIRLDKVKSLAQLNDDNISFLLQVLIAGSQDFSLVGRPIIQKGLVDVQATIIEKSLSHTRTHFKKKRRKQFQRINFYRSPTTMIRINSISFSNLVDDKTQTPDKLEVF